MDSPEQRLRRKRSTRSSATQFLLVLRVHLFSVRSFLLCVGFLGFILLCTYTVRLNSSGFRPVLKVPNLALLSSSSDSVEVFDGLFSLPKVEDRILLPDHILLLVSNDGFAGSFNGLDCIYGSIKRLESSDRDGSSDERGSSAEIVRQKVVSVDEYDDSRVAVRCPLPPLNFSAAVHLDRRKEKGVGWSLEAKNGLVMDFNLSVHSWENLTYAATLDRGTVVVFVKGLNIRAGRESDPSQFRCYFRSNDRDNSGEKMVSTGVITAAQEVVRCYVPGRIKNSTKEGEEFRVAIGITQRVNARTRKRVVLPSVAKVVKPKPDGRDEVKVKRELCVCTMVWNQAATLREWIMYHAWLGVERWFIYDNNSDDGIKEVIDGLNEYNVTRHVWPWVKTQEAGFSHCALRAKDECNWVAFMDVDEFFYFPYSTTGQHRYRRWADAGQNGLKALVSGYSSSPRIAEIRTSCYSFGPSGLTSPPPQGVTTGYTCRLQSPERHKSIIRPTALDTTLLNVVHHFHLRKGFRYLNLPQSTAVINHYKYQVWDVFKAKFHRRVATYVADWQENQNEGSRDRAPGLGTEAIEPPNWSRQFCDVWDTGLRDFVLANLANPSSGSLPWESLLSNGSSRSSVQLLL